MEAHKSRTPCFLCQSLLLSTVVLNDSIIQAQRKLDTSRAHCIFLQNIPHRLQYKNYH